MNKKGQIFQIINIYTFFFIVGMIVALGLFLVLSGAVINMVGDNIIPPLQTSASNAVGPTAGTFFGMAGTVNDSIPWIVGIVYILALVFIVVLAYAFRISGEKYLIVLYLVLSVVVILLSILSSNVYQDFYSGSGALAAELQSMDLISYLILYSPMIMSAILSIGAIIIFSGMREAEL